MKPIFSFLAALCLFINATAQENITNKGIRIGQTVPDVTVTGATGLKIHNQAVTSFRFSQLQGKFVILDFWATWCAPCRKMAPVLDSLQKQFGDQVIFLQVAYESAATVAPVQAAMQKVKPYQLPSVTSDIVLNQLFPHRSLPHFVWIDSRGVVKAITEEKEVTAAHIRKMLQSGDQTAPALAVKQDLVLPYDRKQPMFTGRNALPAGALKYHAVLSGYVPGLEGGMDIYPFDSVSGQRSNVRNVPLPWLFRMAYSDHNRWFSGATMRLLTADSARMETKLSGQAYEDWLSKGNGYCYELIVPPALAPRSFDIMKEDIARLFPQYHVAVENNPTRCLVLVRTTAVDKLKTTGGKSTVDVTPFKAALHNTRLGQLVKRLQVQFLEQYPLPIVDGTGYQGPVDLAINAPLNDVAAMNRELAAYDLRFVEKETNVDLLVVRDSDPKLPNTDLNP
nr:TlpA family protein disulfide reductase [Mucilaginibacter sp. L294]